jgi:hypothetical protein
MEKPIVTGCPEGAWACAEIEKTAAKSEATAPRQVSRANIRSSASSDLTGILGDPLL